MKRITKQTKAIADAHILARANNTFDDPKVDTKEQLIDAINAGQTSSHVMHQIEMRFVSITSNIYSSVFEHQTQAYKNAVYKGFKILLQN